MAIAFFSKFNLKLNNFIGLIFKYIISIYKYILYYIINNI